MILKFKPIYLIGLALFLHCFVSSAQVTILVNKGKFGSIDEAANADDIVNWNDADKTDDRACTECFAVTELLYYLPLGTNIQFGDIKLDVSGKLPAAGDVIIVGSRQSNKRINSMKVPLTGELKSDQSFRIQTLRQNNRTITIIEGKDRAGTLYGVYKYLGLAGITFYGLGKTGTVYPDKKAGLPQNLNIVENPSFLSRGFIGLGNRGDKDIYYWMARNRMNYCDESGKDVGFRKKLGMVLVRGSHTNQGEFIPPKGEYPYNHPFFKGDENKPKDPYLVSKDYRGDTNGDGKLSYFEAHPDWYGLRNGKRSDKIDIFAGDNFCTSNKDACQELAKNLVQSLINGRWKNTDIANFWMLDNGRWCECDNCKKHGELSDRLFDVAYVILKEIKKAQEEGRLNRNVLLATEAYHETLPPPQRALPKDFDYDNFSLSFYPIERCYVHFFDDPDCTEINNFLYDSYKGWAIDPNRNYRGSILMGEYYNVSSFKSLPILFTKNMAHDIPWYYQTSTRHMNYLHTPTHLWGTWTLNQYLFASLLWNHQTDVDKLLDDYFTRYYPTSNEHTRKFYQLLEQALSNLKPFKHYAGKNFYKMRVRLSRDTMNIFPLDHLHYESYHPEKNDGPDIVEMMDFMKQARTEIDAAMLQCRNKTEEARLIEDERRFSYGEDMVNFYYHLIRTALFHRAAKVASAKQEFQKAKDLAEKLRNITDLVAPLPGTGRGGDANAANGFEAAQVDDEYEYFRKKYDN